MYVVIFSRLYFKGQMLVHLCLFVVLSLMSRIVCICLIIFEQINDDDDDDGLVTELKIILREILRCFCN